MKQKFILLADDLGEASRTGVQRSELLLELAIEMCRRLDSALELFYVESFKPGSLSGPEMSSLARESKLYWQKFEEEILASSSSGPSVSHFTTGLGDPVERILSRTKRIRPLMLILGTRGRKGLAKFFLGSVAEEVVRRSSTPVLVFGPEAVNKKFHLKKKGRLKVLLVTDLRRSSKPAEIFLNRIASDLEAQVHILHSVGDSLWHLRKMNYQRRIPLFNFEEKRTEMIAQARAALGHRVREFRDLGVSAKGILVKEEKDLAETLKQEITNEYDLVVMGTHSRSKVVSAFLGSAARKTCLMSPVPVLLVGSE